MKVKDFYLKNKTYIDMGVTVALILLANFFYVTWPIATAFLIFAFATSKFDKQICYCVFLAVFSGVSPIYVSALLLCFLMTAIRYVIDVSKKRKPFFKTPFFITLAIVVVASLIFGKVDVKGFFNWALFTCLMFFVYFAFVYGREIDVKKCFDFLFVAIVVSAVLGLAFCPINKIKNAIYPFDGTYNRLRLFALNVNHLAMFCMFSLTYVVCCLMKNHITKKASFEFFKEKKFWFEFVKICILFVIGLLTMSKAFLLVVAFVFVYFLIFLVCKLQWKSLILIVPAIVGVGLLALLFKDFVSDLVSRFVVYGSWDSLISKIFTGRTDIWLDYFEAMANSPLNLIFGFGLLTKDVVSSGPHNVFVYLLFRVGIVGVVALFVLVCFYIKNAKSKLKVTFDSLLVLMVYILFSLEEMVFSDRFFLFLVFGILMAFQNKENEKIEENRTKEQKIEEKDVTSSNKL